MPPIWAGRRRGLFIALVALGVLQAFLALIMALTVDTMLSAAVQTDIWDIATLVGSALGIGLARWIERVVAEDLGQDYVFEQRHRLITSSVAGADYSGSLGVTVTRASNDLSAVRNWIAMGIVPLVTGIPLIGVVLFALLILDREIGLGVTIPLVLIGAAIPMLSKLTFERSRALRRQRGRLSARIADTVMASESVRASGAVARELKQINKQSDKVVGAAVDRAWVTGLTRAVTATAASACTVVVVLVADRGLADAATVASAMTLLGVLATPVTDLGRVVEYRQNYKAATRILAPLLEKADRLREREARRQRAWRKTGADINQLDFGPVDIDHLIVNDYLVEPLHAEEGQVVEITASDPSQVRMVLSAVLSSHVEDQFYVDGYDFGLAPEKARRALVGFASDYIPLERGSVSRLLKFRVPDASEEDVAEVLEMVDLTKTVANDEKGLSRQLKNDGAPWTIGDVMRLKVARAILNQPALLVFEDVDHQLDPEAMDTFFEFVADYPGVVIISTSHPEKLPEDRIIWDVDGVLIEEDDYCKDVPDEDAVEEE
ncbi:ABC transporter transmembrane domain-containing protein [Corynebacterium cystitidis]|uniref:ABC-type multidrug transport system, ATPase and permease component n=1 Tax=Corynebacterium cystitidis DSM 20524 TaxID=1121357 RepID=A0A1H9S4K2_9CORY|nr:ABC transporter transmembrane domain-containing protein [Corynebacterium cystitidis]WJY82211.1 Putative multidrug export ATP-binding/permease protein [Corynebacterium cystitidis DSM 20524]SER79952.1 ABC-type multidrug transport system, ATPase and permease component [Corynebacterium cystitidis DSM 20524]SNV77785.1 ABC-type multidrug/protein/lipid transport system, ATPase [Corynebacterium cystitidis]